MYSICKYIPYCKLKRVVISINNSNFVCCPRSKLEHYSKKFN